VDAVQGLRALGFLGSNVTIPHKQAVLPLMDTISEQAKAVGAVNTIVCRKVEASGQTLLYGDNTDVAGFLEPLTPFEPVLSGKPMVIFGAGGAARAVVYALLKSYSPSRLTLAVRNTTKAENLVKDLCIAEKGQKMDVVSIEDAGQCVQQSTLLVNATPLGMYPDNNGSPWLDSRDFSHHQIVYDLVYNPRDTRFMQEAGRVGATVIGGLEMLIHQAAASYRQWTGKAMPIDAVRSVL